MKKNILTLISFILTIFCYGQQRKLDSGDKVVITKEKSEIITIVSQNQKSEKEPAPNLKIIPAKKVALIPEVLAIENKNTLDSNLKIIPSKKEELIPEVLEIENKKTPTNNLKIAPSKKE